jgi:hypothetical protein
MAQGDTLYREIRDRDKRIAELEAALERIADLPNVACETVGAKVGLAVEIANRALRGVRRG